MRFHRMSDTSGQSNGQHYERSCAKTQGGGTDIAGGEGFVAVFVLRLRAERLGFPFAIMPWRCEPVRSFVFFLLVFFVGVPVFAKKKKAAPPRGSKPATAPAAGSAT